MSALSAFAARFGVAAMPPQAIARADDAPPIEVDAHGEHDGGNVLVEALGHLEGAVVLIGSEPRRLDRQRRTRRARDPACRRR